MNRRGTDRIQYRYHVIRMRERPLDRARCATARGQKVKAQHVTGSARRIGVVVCSPHPIQNARAGVGLDFEHLATLYKPVLGMRKKPQRDFRMPLPASAS